MEAECNKLRLILKNVSIKWKITTPILFSFSFNHKYCGGDLYFLKLGFSPIRKQFQELSIKELNYSYKYNFLSTCFVVSVSPKIVFVFD